MEILNIDELATPATKKIVLNGKEYEVNDISVQAFINFSKKDKELDKDPNTTEGEKISNMIDMICELIPSCPKEILMALQFNQVQAIFMFCRGVMVETIMQTFGLGDSEKTEQKGEQKKGKRTIR